MAENTRTDAIKGYGVTLAYADVGSTTYTPIAQIKDLTGPELDSDDIDVSNNSSPNMTREFMAGWQDSGEVETEVVYTKAQAATLYSIYRVTKNYLVTLSDGSTIKFTGYLKTLGIESPQEEEVRQSITIKVSGEVTFTPATAP